MDTSRRKERRKLSRSKTNLKAIVQVKNRDDSTWKETADVTTLSRSGASFLVSRQCDVGRLLTLVLPMPSELRAYDHDEDLYATLAIVQHSNLVANEDGNMYHTGVGFIGNRIPESYKANPEQDYRLIGASRDGLWNIVESGKQFISRREPRFPFVTEVSLSLLKKKPKAVERESTVTKDISYSGISVESKLNAEIGDRVKVTCKQYEFYSMAAVRNRLGRSDGKHSIHLEFIDNKFPVEKIPLNEYRDDFPNKGFEVLLDDSAIAVELEDIIR